MSVDATQLVRTRAHDSIRSNLVRFHARVHGRDGTEGENTSGHEADRGLRSRLKRCTRAEEALLIEEYYALRGSILNDARGKYANSDLWLPQVAILIGWVDGETTKTPMGTLLAKPADGSTRARLSDLRFRRLLQSDDSHERLVRLRDAIRMLDGTASLSDLVEAFVNWPTARKRWAEQYYEERLRHGAS